MGEFKLFSEVGRLSTKRDWERAKLEWELDRIYEIADGEESQECLCGHYPIREVCVLVNTINKEIIEVGNHCVNKFFDIPSEKIFAGIKKVRKDITKSFPQEVINHALAKGYIDEWKFNFYTDIRSKRKLYEKQMKKKIEINRSILSKMDINDFA